MSLYFALRMCPLHRYAEVSGFQGILAGLLVALKQTIPDSDVTLLRVIKFRAKVRLLVTSGVLTSCLRRTRCANIGLENAAETRTLTQSPPAAQHLVGIYVVLSLLGCLVLGGVIKTMPSVLFGAYFGWLYLRIWQVKGEAGLTCAASSIGPCLDTPTARCCDLSICVGQHIRLVTQRITAVLKNAPMHVVQRRSERRVPVRNILPRDCAAGSRQGRTRRWRAVRAHDEGIRVRRSDEELHRRWRHTARIRHRRRQPAQVSRCLKRVSPACFDFRQQTTQLKPKPASLRACPGAFPESRVCCYPLHPLLLCLWRRPTRRVFGKPAMCV